MSGQGKAHIIILTCLEEALMRQSCEVSFSLQQKELAVA